MPEPDLNPTPAPCPFCGSRMISTGEGYECAFMECEECGAYGPSATIGEGKHYDIARELWEARVASVRWVSASEGEPPVTDTCFAVLLIPVGDGDPSDGRSRFFLRPHYPGAKKPVPADCHWLLLPPIPEGS